MEPPAYRACLRAVSRRQPPRRAGHSPHPAPAPAPRWRAGPSGLPQGKAEAGAVPQSRGEAEPASRPLGLGRVWERWGCWLVEGPAKAHRGGREALTTLLAGDVGGTGQLGAQRAFVGDCPIPIL